jgi:DNA-binding beta-propeller fold protein YncE
VVSAGATAVTAPVQVLKTTGPIPPTLTAATLDGVTRRALAPVSNAEPLVAKSAVLGTADGATYAVAVGRFPTGPGGPRPTPTVLVSRTAPFFPEEPIGGPEFNGLHAVRPDLTPIREREIGVWPRSIAVDDQRRRVYVVHGSTVSALDAGTLATVATQTIGINASMVAVDPAADLVYVTRYSHGTVHVLRGADLSVVQIFGDKPTLRGCLGVAVHPEGGRLYVARNFRIAEPTATAVTSIVRRPDGSHVIDRDAPFGPAHLQPHAVAVDGPAGLVFVACQGGGGVHPTLLTLDAQTLATVSTVVVPGPGMSVAARPGTGIAYLACYSGLVLVDGRAGSIALTVKAGSHPQGVAVDPVTGTAYLTDRSDRTVTRIETPATVTTKSWR